MPISFWLFLLLLPKHYILLLSDLLGCCIDNLHLAISHNQMATLRGMFKKDVAPTFFYKTILCLLCLYVLFDALIFLPVRYCFLYHKIIQGIILWLPLFLSSKLALCWFLTKCSSYPLKCWFVEIPHSDKCFFTCTSISTFVSCLLYFCLTKS